MIDATHLSTAYATTAVIAARFLTPVARSCQALAVNVKQAHWNLRGASFLGIHKLLDTLAASAREGADAAAERVVSLGLPLDARLSTIAGSVHPTAVAGAFAAWDDSVRAVIQDLDEALADIDRAIAGLDGTDLVSQDLAVALKGTFEHSRWLLHAHVGP